MNKRLKIEGSGASKFVQAIRSISDSSDISIETASVINPPPSIKIRLDSDGIELESDEITVAGNLTSYSRQATIDGTSKTIKYSGLLSVGDRVIVVCNNDNMRYFVLDKAVT